MIGRMLYLLNFIVHSSSLHLFISSSLHLFIMSYLETYNSALSDQSDGFGGGDLDI